MSRGILLAVAGPSGVGKGTVLESVRKRTPDLFYSISATTRAKREHETEGKNYFFVSRGEFEWMLAAGDLLEYTEYCGNYYGTPVKPVEDMLSKGKIVVLEIDVEGVWQIDKKFPDAVTVFIMTSSFEELKRRLLKRGTESADQIQKRLERAAEEALMAQKFDYVIINDKLENAVADLISIIRAEQCKTKRNVSYLKGENTL